MFKDQYTSGYAKEIAGCYALVARFPIRQYSVQYTYCILKELWGTLVLRGNNKSVYMMYTAWSRMDTDMFCGRYVYRFLHLWKDDLFFITDVYFTYAVRSIRFIYYCFFKVVYSNFQSLFIRTYKLYKNLLQLRFTIQDPFQTIRHLLYNYLLEIIQEVYIR